jgi:predicted flap endonuclease-1-like 5' DNA nuclease
LVSLGSVRRLARILGVIGGVGAILWAMRDRLLSVAIPREPQQPAFRVPERPSRSRPEAKEEEPSPHGVTDVNGIGPVYATRLEAAGVTTLSDLARSDAEDIAKAADVTAARAGSWIESARALLEG